MKAALVAFSFMAIYLSMMVTALPVGPTGGESASPRKFFQLEIRKELADIWRNHELAMKHRRNQNSQLTTEALEALREEGRYKRTVDQWFKQNEQYLRPNAVSYNRGF